jgi:hypothetical protein
VHAYAAGSPASTSSAAVSAASAPPRAAGQVPAPIGVIVSNAKDPVRAQVATGSAGSCGPSRPGWAKK